MQAGDHKLDFTMDFQTRRKTINNSVNNAAGRQHCLAQEGSAGQCITASGVTEITETRTSCCFSISVGLGGRCCRPYHL